MTSVLFSAVGICLLSLVLGGAVLRLAGREGWSWLAPAVGLAATLVLAGLAASLPGRGLAVVVVLAVAFVAALAVLVRSRPAIPLGDGGLVAAITGLAAALPFLISGRVGVLGAGLVNDDMASHLVMADWVERGSGPEPGLVQDGYPLGPHSVVAGLSELGVTHVAAFAGLTIALAVLLGWVALSALEDAGARPRLVAAALCALPYLTASYLAQGAFKEPLLVLLVVALALLLDEAAEDVRGLGSGWEPSVGRRAAAGVPIGLVVAGGVYAYSFPALFWFAGTAVAWVAIRLLWGGRRRLAEARAQVGPALGVAAAATAVAVALALPELGRIARFAGFKAFDPGTDGLGNLGHPLSPLEALGIWPTGDFRVSAADAELPAAVFALGGAFALAITAWGAVTLWRRRSGAGLLASLFAAGVIYLGSALTVTAYASAKALAAAATPAMIIALKGLLSAGPSPRRGEGERRRAAAPPRWRRAVAVAFVLAAGGSTLLVLRQAVVAPTDHMEELDEIRSVVAGERVLFLGRDNFVLYELRDSKPYTHVRNYYNPYFVRPNFALREVGSKFDFDAVAYSELTSFPYVLTTRASYASGPPTGYEVAAETPSYVLWEAPSAFGDRRPAERGPDPTGTLRCPDRPTFRPLRAAAPRVSPVRVGASAWSAPTLESGSTASIELDVPAGRWALSLQYDSTESVRLTAPGLEAELPGNLDYRGVAPFWAAGELRSGGEPVTLTATVDGPSLLGELLGVRSTAHLGDVGLTAAAPSYVDGASPPHPGQGSRIVPNRRACGEEADFVDVRAEVVVD